ncbi:hypothetical protein A0H81_02068 [Grifola frondosa]|uniref:Uncharacterized protein n=1 Tax=Grifola frondosa TaxID=5627 RepID=A0A1C7MLG0_GRIFR|nr:hypothetical protein A0H81_02068 [Grifola frondosa]
MAKYKLFMPQDFLTENQTEFPTLLNLLPKDVFPFAEPPGLALPSMIIFPEIHEAPLHTTNASTTKTASAVEGLLHTEQELRELRQAPELWQNLARYADMATDRPYPSTFTARPAGSDIPEPLGLPSAQQQADAIYQIWAWFLYHHLRDEVAVTGKSAFKMYFSGT